MHEKLRKKGKRERRRTIGPSLPPLKRSRQFQFDLDLRKEAELVAIYKRATNVQLTPQAQDMLAQRAKDAAAALQRATEDIAQEMTGLFKLTIKGTEDPKTLLQSLHTAAATIRQFEARLRQAEARLRQVERAQGAPAAIRGGAMRGEGQGRGHGRRETRAPPSSSTDDFCCLCCGEMGHGVPTCPKGNKAAQKMFEEKRAARTQANAKRPVRRAAAAGFGSDGVSDDEVTHDKEAGNVSAEISPTDSEYSTTSSHYSGKVLVPTLPYAFRTLPTDFELTLELALDLALACGQFSARFLQSFPALRKVSPSLEQMRFEKGPWPNPTPVVATITIEPDIPIDLVHLYQVQCRVTPASHTGAVMDTGAQIGAAKSADEVISESGKQQTIVSATGNSATMRDVVMGCKTKDILGRPITLLIPSESVSDSSLIDSLIPVGKLMESGFKVLFRLPQEAIEDNVCPHTYPFYGGYIKTPGPHSRTIYMVYSQHTWRLPLPGVLRHTSGQLSTHATLNAFSVLLDKPVLDPNPVQPDLTEIPRD